MEEALGERGAAEPKSVSWRWPEASSSRFCGLMSLRIRNMSKRFGRR